MKFEYFVNKKKEVVNVKVCKSLFSKVCGLMFKRKSLPLLFVFNKEKKLSIHSFFCKPFRAVWIDRNKKATKVVDVLKWKANIFGMGKYLLELPTSKFRK